MLQQHPNCPKSAMEKYYIEQQLPEYQTVPQKQAQKKNHSYYHENTHIWNNPHQSSSNMKVFSKILEQNSKGDKRIKELREREQRDKQFFEMSRRIYLAGQREEDLMRMQTRKLERAGLQNLSAQQSDIEADQLLIKRNQQPATLQGRPEFVWNKVGSQSQKHVRMLVNPRILAMEEEAVKLIEKRITKDQQVQQIKKDLTLENMKRIRELTTRRQQENVEMQCKAGLSPIIRREDSYSFNQRPQTTSKSVQKRALRMDRSEFKGLYIAQACDQSDNNFNRTIRSNCPELFEGISNNHLRQRQLRHSKCEPQEDVNKILDSFENKLYQNH